jgi:hypothetical protein
LVIFITTFRKGTAGHGVRFPAGLQPDELQLPDVIGGWQVLQDRVPWGTLLYGVTPAGGASMVIETYSFERVSTGKLVVLDRSSFLLAAVGGPIYVLLSGFFLEALAMMVVTVLIVAGAAFAVVATIGILDSELISLAAVLVIPLGALFLQGRVAMRLTRRGYLRRGWIERY